MNFSILSQFFGLTSAPSGDPTGRTGSGPAMAAGQTASGAATENPAGHFAALLQALGLGGVGGEAGADAVLPDAAGGSGQRALSGTLVPAMPAGDAMTFEPEIDGAASLMAEMSLATDGTGAEAANKPALFIRMADGSTLALDATRLAEMVKGTASPEEMALFEQTPLGQLLQRKPELRPLLTKTAEEPNSAFPAELLSGLDDDEAAMIVAAAGLIMPHAEQPSERPLDPSAKTQVTVAATAPNETNSHRNAPASHPLPTDETPEELLAAALDNDAVPEDGASEIMAASEATTRRAVSAATAGEVATNAANGRNVETRETPVTSAPAADKNNGPAEVPIALDDGDAELPEPPLAALRGRGAAATNQKTGTASSSATATSKVASDQPVANTSPAAGRDNGAAVAEIRRPAQQTASDMLALLRSDWGSGWSDGWADPREDLAASGGLTGLTSLSAGAAGAAKPATQPLSYHFAGPAVAGQVALQISRSVQNGADSFQIRLDPPELGRVDVKLDIAHDGRVTAVVAVDNEQTLQLLMRDQGLLERALQEAGLKTDSGSLNFSLNQGGGRDAQTADDTGRAQREREQARAAMDTSAPIQPVYISDRALDLRV